MSELRLSPRLQQVADYALPCAVLADIGTDHANLPIYAIEHALAQRAIATDLRTGPLERARTNVALHRLTTQISLRHGDGLAPIERGEADVIVSAGIGGHVHAQLLRAGEPVAKAAKCIVLQPMNAGHLVRSTLYDLGFHIVAETLVAEGDKLYEIIAAEPKDDPDPAYASAALPRFLTEASAAAARHFLYTYGPMIVRSRHPLAPRRASVDLERLRWVLSRLPDDASDYTDRQFQLSHSIRMLESWLQQMEEIT
ncbi:SAM-dependent methyltransferase [Alicyclobacillus hesperidum]|uniref:SAM-dependent methyltransferase n=1 Tax=Alicyclobacillus hesperidum TaxID=89784 RepID=A0AA37U6N2_9BACL|nr:class I SAM-dependent methyltransferase [Alicyclobacillus hesperidum]GLV14119.1 SAM-dependent methyltransferase [Alicyclobacillus hesperidum]